MQSWIGNPLKPLARALSTVNSRHRQPIPSKGHVFWRKFVSQPKEHQSPQTGRRGLSLGVRLGIVWAAGVILIAGAQFFVYQHAARREVAQLGTEIHRILRDLGAVPYESMSPILAEQMVEHRLAYEYLVLGVGSAAMLVAGLLVVGWMVLRPLNRALRVQWVNPDQLPELMDLNRVPSDQLGVLMRERNRLAQRVRQLELHLQSNVHRAKSEQLLQAHRQAYLRMSQVVAKEISRFLTLLEGVSDEFRAMALSGFASPDALYSLSSRLDYASEQFRVLETRMAQKRGAPALLAEPRGSDVALPLAMAVTRAVQGFERETRKIDLPLDLGEFPVSLADYVVNKEWEEMFMWLLTFVVHKTHQDGLKTPRRISVALHHPDGQAARVVVRAAALPLNPEASHEWFVPFSAAHGDPHLALLLAMARSHAVELEGEFHYVAQEKYLEFVVTVPRWRRTVPTTQAGGTDFLGFSGAPSIEVHRDSVSLHPSKKVA